MWLHASDAVENCDRAIQNAQGALHFSREIYVAGCVDDVDALLDSFENLVNARLLPLRPSASCRRRSNRDSAFALLLHPVGDGGAFVHLTHPVDHAGVKQNALRERRFAGINMRRDADVPRSLQREFAIRRIRILRGGLFLFHDRRRHNRYHLKCANARFACAILCVSSRFLIALP